MVTNFDIKENQWQQINELCCEKGVEFVYLNPTSLVSKLEGKSKIFEAACYLNAVFAPDRPYDHYSFHKFGEVALNDISKKQSENYTFDEKLETLKDIATYIFEHSLIKDNIKRNISHVFWSRV
ncbi:hypothetical protein B5G50_21480 [Brevibacillus brevis]|nr:hypothetical protein B5G50_21480 [Brevibacillus brevis]